MTVYHSPNCHHCGLTEDLEHLLLQCTEAQNFWLQIQHLITKLTDNTITLNDTTKLFGYLRKKDDTLDKSTTNLLNWILTLARVALHKSAATFRLHGQNVAAYTLFSIMVKSHLTQQFKISKLKHTTYLFPYTWGLKDAIVQVNNDVSIQYIKNTD